MHPDEPAEPDGARPDPGPGAEHERLARLANLLFQAARNGDAFGSLRSAPS